MSGDDMTPKEILVEMVLPQLQRIEESIRQERQYADQTFVRKDTQEEVSKQSDRFWSKRGVIYGGIAAGAAIISEVVTQIVAHAGGK